jgi:predicted nucleic acid-binding Zn ribbon protein
MSKESKNKCLQCGKEIHVVKYFCSIECEVKYTDQQNKQISNGDDNETK